MKTAFTLIEILIVVILLAILAAIVVPNFMDFSEETNASSAESTARSLNSSWGMYVAKSKVPGSGITVTGTDYAGATAELVAAGLIDEAPAAGMFEGWTLGVTGTGDTLRFTATAN